MALKTLRPQVGGYRASAYAHQRPDPSAAHAFVTSTHSDTSLCHHGWRLPELRIRPFSLNMFHRFFVPGLEKKKHRTTLCILASAPSWNFRACICICIRFGVPGFFGVYLRSSWFLHHTFGCFSFSCSKIPIHHSLLFSFVGIQLTNDPLSPHFLLHGLFGFVFKIPSTTRFYPTRLLHCMFTQDTQITRFVSICFSISRFII